MIKTVERKRERETARRSSYKSQQRHSTRHCMAWVESISGREGAATAHASQQEHTQRAKTQDSQKRSAERERRAEEERRHSRSSSHPATGFSGRSDPFPTPTPAGGDQEKRWAGGSGHWGGDREKPVGAVVGTFPTNTGGDRENRWAWWSITRYLPPTLAQAVTGRTGGRDGQDLLLGGRAIDTRSRVWMINLPFQ